MALNWTPRVDGQDDVMAEDVNTLANAISGAETDINSLSSGVSELETVVQTHIGDDYNAHKMMARIKKAIHDHNHDEDAHDEIFYTKQQVDEKIDAAATTVYNLVGPATVTELNAISSEPAIGDVYSITEGGNLDKNPFDQSSATISVSAGNSVSWSEDGWYILPGSVDLSNYATTSDVSDTISTHNESELAHEDIRDDIEQVDSAVTTHVNDTNNPHEVTKTQIGLGNVDNVKQATKTEFDEHVNNDIDAHGIVKDALYKNAGPATVSMLNTATEVEENSVYTVTDAGTVKVNPAYPDSETFDVVAGDRVVGSFMFDTVTWEKFTDSQHVTDEYIADIADDEITNHNENPNAHQSMIADKISEHNVATITHTDIRDRVDSFDHYYDIKIIPASTDLFDIEIINNEAAISGIKTGAEIPEILVLPYQYISDGEVYPITSVQNSSIASQSIVKLIFPDTIVDIEEDAIIAENLVTAVIPVSVEHIGEGAFFNTNLSEVYYTGTEAEWNLIDIESPNDFLIYSTKHYNYRPAKITDVKDAINTAIVGVFALQGSATVAELNALDEPTSVSVGYMYTMSDGGSLIINPFSQSSDTITVVAGDCVSWTADGWKDLGQLVDLSDYSTTDQMNASINTKIGAHNTNDNAHTDIRNEMSAAAGVVQSHVESTTAHGIGTTVSNAITSHNTSDSAHSDIRNMLDDITVPTANLFNVNDPDVFDGRIGASGSIIQDNTLLTTGYFEVQSGDTIYCTRKRSSDNARVNLNIRYYYIFDAQKNRIGDVHQAGTDVNTFTISDAGAVYARITFEKAQWGNNLLDPMICTTADAEYVPYGVTINPNTLTKPVNELIDVALDDFVATEDNVDFVKDSSNVFDMTSVGNQNNYILDSTKTVDNQTTRNDAHFISHIIPCQYGDVIRLNTDFYIIYGFKADGTYSRAYTLAQYPSRTVTIDRYNVTQIRVDFEKTNLSENWIQSCMITKNNDMPTVYEPFGETFLTNDITLNDTQKNKVVSIINNTIGKGADILQGKILACAGDSITYGLRADVDPDTGWYKTYGALVALRHGMTYYNYGISGSTLSNVSGHNAFSDTRYTNMADDIDYLTIWFGYNDYAYATLGTIDSSDDSTFYGAWNKVLPYLIDKYPTTKIGLVVPYATNANWREAVRLIGKKWGLPYFDLMSEYTPLFYDKEYTVDADTVVARQATFLADGTHPNQTGYDYLSTIFENWLLSL